MRSISIPAYAKVNLRLHVLGRRADGYHELRTIFQTISLHDTLEMELTRGGKTTLEVVMPSGPKAREGLGFHLSKNRSRSLAGQGRLGMTASLDTLVCPSGRENLVWRAVDAYRREFVIKSGVRVRLTKRIPIGAGLGGGSSDAAAALIGMVRLTARSVRLKPDATKEHLLEIAAGLGADVPFFLLGGRALGVGRGDEIYPLPDLERTQTLLVVAPQGIAINTKEAYGWLAAHLTKPRIAPKISSFCALCWSPQGTSLENDFEAAVFRRHPRLAAIKRELLRQGAQEAALAGSGSAVFGVYRHPAQARRTAQSFPNDRTFVVETLSREKYRKAVGV